MDSVCVIIPELFRKGIHSYLFGFTDFLESDMPVGIACYLKTFTFHKSYSKRHFYLPIVDLLKEWSVESEEWSCLIQKGVSRKSRTY